MKHTKLINELESKGVRIKAVNYRFKGKIISKGFDLIYGTKCIEIEPKDKRVLFVCYQNNGINAYINWSAQHYSPKRNGFTPALCKHISNLRTDILKYFEL